MWPALPQVARLEEIAFEEEALNVIALKADGAMRDALSIFDQVASFSNRNITYQEVLDNLNVLDYEYYFRITEAFLEGSAPKALMIFNEVLQRGFDGQNFIGGLSSHFRDLLVCHDEATLQLLEVSEALKIRYRQQALVCSNDFLFSSLEICDQCELTFKASRNQRLHIEIALIRLSNMTGEKKKLISNPNLLAIPDLAKPGERKQTVESPVIQEKEIAVTSTLTREPEQSYNATPRISIRDALKAAETNSVTRDNPAPEIPPESQPAPVDHEDLKPVSGEFLLLCWNSFAGQIREDKPRMAVTLKSVNPVITDNDTITIELNNRSQLEDFNNNTKHELEKFLRREMQNSRITVEANLIEITETQQDRLYTNEEKFRYLSQKNPALTTLRQKLNLELE